MLLIDKPEITFRDTEKLAHIVLFCLNIIYLGLYPLDQKSGF